MLYRLFRHYTYIHVCRLCALSAFKSVHLHVRTYVTTRSHVKNKQENKESTVLIVLARRKFWFEPYGNCDGSRLMFSLSRCESSWRGCWFRMIQKGSRLYPRTLITNCIDAWLDTIVANNDYSFLNQANKQIRKNTLDVCIKIMWFVRCVLDAQARCVHNMWCVMFAPYQHWIH